MDTLSYQELVHINDRGDLAYEGCQLKVPPDKEISPGTMD